MHARSVRTALLGLTLLTLAALPVAAQERISTRAAFLDRVAGQELSRLGISVRATPGGAIAGRALGQDVTGMWDWSGSFFCRTLSWGSRSWARDCQAVQVDGDRVYFIGDKGRGQSVWLTLN